MKILNYSVLALMLATVQEVKAQVTQPVPTPSIVYGSYLAGYTCRATYTGNCELVVTPQSLSQSDQATSFNFFEVANFGGIETVSGKFDNSEYLPILGASASGFGIPPSVSNPNPAKYTGQVHEEADANIWTVAKYRYKGYPATLSLSALLETNINLPNNNVLLGHSLMEIGVFTSNDYNYSVDGICPIGGFAGCHTNSTNLGHLQVSLSTSDRYLLEIDYDVVPGQEFYVGAFLDANACCNGFVDSSHTMTMHFSDTSNLELLAVPGAPVAQTVDEPPSILISIMGLFATLYARTGFFRPKNATHGDARSGAARRATHH